jgi:hypothetical protein
MAKKTELHVAIDRVRTTEALKLGFFGHEGFPFMFVIRLLSSPHGLTGQSRFCIPSFDR